ncbi:MAG TPA: DUF4468 domain-containing protein [Bacteroidales bacterium]|nr:DUF4468 domain-containing protein [Bacteroidales bacterium]
MKKIIIISFIALSSIITNAQTSSFDERTEVITIDSVSKDILYSTAQSWFAKNFNDSKNVLEITDKESGKLFGKGKVALGNLHGSLSFTITIIVKENKYKYTFSDFTSTDVMMTNVYHTTPTNGIRYYDFGPFNQEKPNFQGTLHSKKCWAKMQQQALIIIDNLIQNLKDFMSKNSKSENDF